MKHSLVKKIQAAKAEPDYLTRAKIRVDSVMNPYQAQIDNTQVQQPIVDNKESEGIQPNKNFKSPGIDMLLGKSKKPTQTYDEWAAMPKVKIEDTRTIHPVTGGLLDTNKDLKTGSYRKDRIEAVVNAAKKYGVNPYHAIAIGLQESGLDEEIGHVRDYDPIKIGLTEEEINNMSQTEIQANLLAYAMKDKAKYADRLGFKGDEFKLQAYNGFGKLGVNTEKGKSQSGNVNGVKKWYGVDVTKEPLDMKKNPAYGKTVLSLAKMLENNPMIKELVTKTTNNTKNLDQH